MRTMKNEKSAIDSVVENFWTEEVEDCYSLQFDTRAEFDDYLRASNLLSLIVLKHDGAVGEINKLINDIWKESSGLDADDHFFEEDGFDLEVEPYKREVVLNYLDLEEENFCEYLIAKNKEEKRKRPKTYQARQEDKKRYVRELKTRVFYDLIIIQCRGDIYEVEKYITRMWRNLEEGCDDDTSDIESDSE